jgi:hypothetical protein
MSIDKHRHNKIMESYCDDTVWWILDAFDSLYYPPPSYAKCYRIIHSDKIHRIRWRDDCEEEGNVAVFRVGWFYQFANLVARISEHINQVYIKRDGSQIEFRIRTKPNRIYELSNIFYVDERRALWLKNECGIALFDSDRNVWLKDPIMSDGLPMSQLMR